MEFSLSVVFFLARKVHGLQREFSDVDIAEVTWWSIGSRAWCAETGVDQLGAATKAETWGLDAVVGGVDLGALVDLTSLVVVWPRRLHRSKSGVFEPVVSGAPLRSFGIVELGVLVINTIFVEGQGLRMSAWSRDVVLSSPLGRILVIELTLQGKSLGVLSQRLQWLIRAWSRVAHISAKLAAI